MVNNNQITLWKYNVHYTNVQYCIPTRKHITAQLINWNKHWYPASKNIQPESVAELGIYLYHFFFEGGGESEDIQFFSFFYTWSTKFLSTAVSGSWEYTYYKDSMGSIFSSSFYNN